MVRAKAVPMPGSAALESAWWARRPASAVPAAYPAPIERISHAYASLVRPVGGEGVGGCVGAGGPWPHARPLHCKGFMACTTTAAQSATWAASACYR